MLLIFIGELVCGVLLIVNRDYAAEVLEDRMRRSFDKYGPENKALSDSIDLAQHEVRLFNLQIVIKYY